MGAEGVLLVGRTIADVRPHQDQRWPAGFLLRRPDSLTDSLQVISILN
jgi:hypothetical protein